MSAFDSPHPIGDQSLRLSVSIGISVYPRMGSTPGNTVDRHVEMMCEANEQLVMAALGAQKLQSGAEHALLLQKDLLARVAHELRNPLTPL
ncbi:hypothetical protein QNM99_05810 [Pseudomonas sp. PCH446]